jgi:phospholipid/cholesterol/gamma-HCH transport system substrate-binding protein
MPDRSKVRWSQLKVGVVCGSAFIILAVLIFLLTSTRGIFQDYVMLRTYMEDASGIVQGTEVRLNGIKDVGYLDQVQLSGLQDKGRTVEFIMKLHANYLKEIPSDSVVGIGAANLLGDKYLNIVRGKSPQPVHEGAVLQSEQSQDIPEMLASFAHLMSSFQVSLNRVDSLLADVEAGKGNIGLLLKDDQFYVRLNAITAEGQQLLADIRHGQGSLSKLIYDPALYDQVIVSLKRVDSIMADVQSGQGTAGKLLKDPALFDSANQTILELKALMADLNAGKGDAGHLLKNTELTDHVNALLTKLDTTLDKITSGQGTVGQLLVNPKLYDALTGATTEFQTLAQDMHTNPKKFLTIQLKLF